MVSSSRRGSRPLDSGSRAAGSPLVPTARMGLALLFGALAVGACASTQDSQSTGTTAGTGGVGGTSGSGGDTSVSTSQSSTSQSSSATGTSSNASSGAGTGGGTGDPCAGVASAGVCWRVVWPGHDLAATPVALAATSDGLVVCGRHTNTGIGGPFGFVLKVGSNGEVLWAHQPAPTEDELGICHGVVATSEGIHALTDAKHITALSHAGAVLGTLDLTAPIPPRNNLAASQLESVGLFAAGGGAVAVLGDARDAPINAILVGITFAPLTSKAPVTVVDESASLLGGSDTEVRFVDTMPSGQVVRRYGLSTGAPAGIWTLPASSGTIVSALADAALVVRADATGASLTRTTFSYDGVAIGAPASFDLDTGATGTWEYGVGAGTRTSGGEWWVAGAAYADGVSARWVAQAKAGGPSHYTITPFVNDDPKLLLHNGPCLYEVGTKPDGRLYIECRAP